MMRLRARILAIVALVLLAPGAGAASIDVTTFGESVDNDDLCSLREAVTASKRAETISARTNNHLQMAHFHDDIADPRNLDRLTFPNQYYPRGNVQDIVKLLRDDLQAHTTVDTALLNEVLAFKVHIDALPDEKVYNKTPDFDVNKAIDLLNRTMVANDAEVARLNALNLIDGCKDGTSFDTILLGEGTYTLNSEIYVNVRLTIKGVGDATVITSSAPARLFNLDESTTLQLEKLKLSGGSAAGNGGAIYVGGSCDIKDVLFEGNTAASGGALYLDHRGSLTIARGRFLDNHATGGDGGAVASIGPRLVITDSTFGKASVADDLGNSAPGGRGGAIYFNPTDEGGEFSLERVSVVNNDAATGSALYIGGVKTATTLLNVTFGRNVASNSSTIEDVATDAGKFIANNVTLVDNSSALTGTGGLRVTALTDVTVANSVIAGNVGGFNTGWGRDCDLSLVTVPAANFQHNYYEDNLTGPSPAGCPGDRPTILTPLATNYELGSGHTVFNWLLQGLNEEKGFYVPIYPVDVLDITENRLVNRAAGTQETYSCTSDDQRGLGRASFVDSDCDIGAIEYQIGVRADDSVTLNVDETSCLDVGANDIGDTFYTPLSLEVLRVERAGASAIIASTDPAAYIAAYMLRHPSATAAPQVVDISQCPNAVNPAFTEAILFTPAPGFHGETNVTYALGWQTGTTVSGTVSGIAKIGTESNGGISSSSLGSFGPAVLGLLGLLAGRRRRRVARGVAPVLALVLLTSAALAHATENIIYVDSGEDPVDADTGIPIEIPGDKKCTLREALSTARNDQANLTGGDCLDGNEGPDVIEIRVPVVTLAAAVVGYGGVTIRCPADSTTTCTITRPNGALDPKFALIDSRGGIAIKGMILENGYAVDGPPGAVDGGAINSSGGVSVSDSIFRGNRARNGGAIFLRGVHGDLTVENSTFEGNQSTGTGSNGGGAIATSAAGQHYVSISGSTFVGNTSIASAAAVSIKTTTEVVIVNSTFSGNASSQGSGAIDVSGAGVGATLRNLTVVGNRSGVDPAGSVQRAAIEFSAGSVTTLLADSIVASNYEAAPSVIDANCGSGGYEPYFNMFGESFANATCAIGLPAVGNQYALDTTVYDGDDLTSTDYLAPLALNGFTTKTHAFNDPISLDGILVDAGSGAALVTPLERRNVACALVDQRGKSRESGGTCDIGAYEYVQVTAVKDVGSNVGRQDRLVYVDILKNDIFEDASRCVPDHVQVTPPPPANQAILLDATNNMCATVTFVPPQQATFVPGVNNKDVIGFETTSEFVLKFDNGGAVTPALTPLTISYVIRDAGGQVSLPANIDISIEDVPPKVVADSVVVPVGATVVVDVLANDSDADATVSAFHGMDPASIKISSGGCSAVKDNSLLPVTLYWNCEFGRATVDPTNGKITWTPFNSFNPFTETITYTASDLQGKDGSANVTISTNHVDANGGGVFGTKDLSDKLGLNWLGAPGGLFFVSLLLSVVRRRRK